MYTLLIYDCLNKSNYIYSTTPVPEDSLYKLFDLILEEIKKMSSDDIHISFISENECEIYVYKENKKNGWLWNTIDTQKQILYKIQPIECLNSTFYETVDKECQTNEIIVNEKQCQTDKLNLSKNIKFNDNIILDDVPLELNQNKTKINWGQLKIKQDFKHELQDRLNLENFGLYKPQKHFKQD